MSQKFGIGKAMDLLEDGKAVYRSCWLMRESNPLEMRYYKYCKMRCCFFKYIKEKDENKIREYEHEWHSSDLFAKDWELYEEI